MRVAKGPFTVLQMARGHWGGMQVTKGPFTVLQMARWHWGGMQVTKGPFTVLQMARGHWGRREFTPKGANGAICFVGYLCCTIGRRGIPGESKGGKIVQGKGATTTFGGLQSSI